MISQRVWAAAVGILAAILLIVALLYARERNAHFNASLRADSAAAAADVSKRVSDAKVTKVLGDSTVAWQRRIIQQTQRADSLDHALNTERKTRSDFGVTIGKGTGKGSGAVSVVTSPAAPADTRQAHFDVTAGVFAVAADVTLPPPPGQGSMSATVTAPTIPLSARQSCGAAVDGVHPALLTVTGPRWATVGITHVEADPAVCNPTMKLDNGRRVPLWVMVTTDILSAGAGYWIGSKASHITVVTK